MIRIELLSRAAPTVTHAGLNTTLESLAFGVPLVAAPITNDQPGVAAWIALTGTGLLVPPRPPGRGTGAGRRRPGEE